MSSPSNYIFAVFALGFGGFGLIILLIYINARMRAAASQSWPSVPGKIESSKVQRSVRSRSSGGSSSSYTPNIHYSYSVDGISYKGKRIGFGLDISGTRSSAEKLVAQYRTGTNQTVYYDPENPARAVLERSVTNSTTAMILIITCLLVGIVSAVIAFPIL